MFPEQLYNQDAVHVFQDRLVVVHDAKWCLGVFLQASAHVMFGEGLAHHERIA